MFKAVLCGLAAASLAVLPLAGVGVAEVGDRGRLQTADLVAVVPPGPGRPGPA